ncbi:MAG: hypothetical protein Q9196_001127 [Gyalolechia fulgens]
MTTPTITILSHTYIQPDLPPCGKRRSVTLGIPDNATAGYSPPQAIWFYAASKDPSVFSTELLIRSLRQTLASYPHFAGRLEHIPYRAQGDWSERFGRLRVVYGTPDDPGVETVVAHCESRLAEIIPNGKERGRIWDASDVPFARFSGQDIKMALHDGFETGRLPATIVKITTFACGGIAIAPRLQHVLGDAQAFLRFMHDWAAVHKNSLEGFPRPVLEPVFDPEMLNSMAAGDINAIEPDEEILETARKLPIHRYDWWASEPSCPEVFQSRTRPSPELTTAKVPPLGNPIPWNDWDLGLSTPHFVLHYSADEISKMYDALASPGQRYEFSRLDALLAHLWAAIVRARAIPKEDEIDLEFAFNFRRRMVPPLPDSLIGVPACMIHVKSLAELALNGQVRELAMAIRKTIMSMNGQTIPSLLHQLAHDIDAQRHWQFVGGKHHVTVTSWLQHRMCEVDFGAGLRPWFVEALMPGWIIQLMESRYDDQLDDEGRLVDDGDLANGHGPVSSGVNGTSAGTGGEETKGRPWYSTGVDISFNLEKGVVEQLVENSIY